MAEEDMMAANWGTQAGCYVSSSVGRKKTGGVAECYVRWCSG